MWDGRNNGTDGRNNGTDGRNNGTHKRDNATYGGTVHRWLAHGPWLYAVGGPSVSMQGMVAQIYLCDIAAWCER